MTKAPPRPGGAGTDAVSTASGQITKLAGLVIPVGLLGDISGHQGVSIGTGGLIIVLVAVWGAGFGMGRSGAAISSPPANPAGLAREPGTSRQRAR